MQRIYCTLPSPHDRRDWKYSGPLTASDLPEEYNVLSLLQPVRDQGSRGTCAAFAATCMKEVQESVDVNYSGYMSPDSVYFYRQNKPQEGMYMRDVMNILLKNGCCREEFQPYSSSEPKTINQKAVQDSQHFKIKGYAQVESIDAAKRALFNEGPILFAFPYYENDQLQFWRPKGNVVGGHAVCCVGYNKEGFILRNSWGSAWSDNGYIIYPYTDWGMHWEIWSSVDEKGSVIVPPSDPVKPAPKSKMRPIRRNVKKAMPFKRR